MNPWRETARAHSFVIGLLFLIGPWFAVSTMSSMAYAAELPCLQCHKSKKTGKVVHPAVGMGCSICHVTPHKEEKPALSLSSEMPGLCHQCHPKSGFENTAVHPPVVMGMCASCHNPHASDRKKLLSGDIPGICFGCHDKSAFTKKTQHSPVAQGQCAFCHHPHASANPFVLQYPPAELCLMCHPDKSEGSHVLAGLSLGDSHPVSGMPDPSRKGREISCTSCHNPHSSGQRALFTHDGNKAETLCLLCHKKSYIR